MHRTPTQQTPWVISRSSSPGAQELRQRLSLNGVAYRWLDPDLDSLVPMLGAEQQILEAQAGFSTDAGTSTGGSGISLSGYARAA